MEIGNRPWGSYYVLEDTDIYKLKRIEVNVGGRLSYQYHNHRAEVWTIVQGTAMVTAGSFICWISTNWSVIRPFIKKITREIHYLFTSNR